MSLEQLRKNRLDWVETNRRNRFEAGIKNLLTQLYPDNAHFIYELLQNSEDTKASLVRFILTNDGLDFEHNGERLFSLPDVESITGIGDSTKRDDPTSIGKFGIGFKAVFAYTNTPEVHSGEFHFRIHDLVVPETDGVCQPRMGEQETRFVFPFDNPKKPSEQATLEIEQGLRALGNNTLLFLSHIRTIEYLLPDNSLGSLERIDHEGGRIEIRSSHPGGNVTVSHWLRFQKEVEALDEDGQSKKCRIAIAHSLVEEEDSKKKHRSTWKIVPLDHGQVSIYFPAEKEASNLRFHLHAPFASTVSRDSVRACKANHQLRDHLAILVVESLASIRDQGMLTVDFLAVLPNPEDNLPEFYSPILESLVTAFKNQALTPTKMGGHAPANDLYCGPAAISRVIDDDDLALLIGDGSIPPKWAANARQENQREDRFLDSLEINEWGWHELVNTIRKPHHVPYLPQHKEENDQHKTLIENWVAKKDDDWLMRFYALLGEARDVHYATVDVSGLRIVRVEADQCAEHVIPKEAFFQLDEGATPSHDIRFVKPTVYSTGRAEERKKFAKSFLEEIGVRPFDARAMIELRLATYKSPPEEVKSDYIKDLKQFIAYWKKNPTEAGLFSGYTFLLDGRMSWRKPEQLCLDNPYLETGLAGLAKIHRKDKIWDGYKDKLGESQLKDLTAFLKAIGAMHGLKVGPADTCDNPCASELRKDFYRSGTRRSNYMIDEDYSISRIDRYLAAQSIPASGLIWDALIHAEAKSAKARFRPNQLYRIREAESQLVYHLKRHAWIPDKSGNFRNPQEMTKDDLRTDFPYDDRNGLLTAIGFGENAKRHSEKYQCRNHHAQQFGFASADVADKMVEIEKLLSERGTSPDELILQLKTDVNKQKPVFPTSTLNSDRRQERLSEQLNNAPEKEYEQRERSVRTTRATIDPDLWLRNKYTNEANQMICQICKKEMPFRKRDGEYYFEAVEALSNDHLTKEHEAQFLALCPLCAAMYKEFVKQDKDAMESFKNALMNSEGPEVPLQLGDMSTSVRFVEKHWYDIRIILKKRD